MSCTTDNIFRGSDDAATADPEIVLTTVCVMHTVVNLRRSTYRSQDITYYMSIFWFHIGKHIGEFFRIDACSLKSLDDLIIVLLRLFIVRDFFFLNNFRRAID